MSKLMKKASELAIRLLGTSYCRIPQHWRRKLGMHCGEDMSDLNKLLERLQNQPEDHSEAEALLKQVEELRETWRAQGKTREDCLKELAEMFGIDVEEKPGGFTMETGELRTSVPNIVEELVAAAEEEQDKPPMPKKVQTVHDMKLMLQYSDDEEPLILRLANSYGSTDAIEIDCVQATSSAGGRATVLWFERKKL